ncbi:hypothetical protein J0H58_18480 [bacterium]|nr:hypothetical protein [bacterium]
MARKKEYDPLDSIPRPEFVRVRLAKSVALTERLRVLLELAEKVHLPPTTADTVTPPAARKAVSRA